MTGSDKRDLIRAIDKLSDAERLIECAFMASESLEEPECSALQIAISLAQARLEDCKWRLYAIKGDGEAS